MNIFFENFPSMSPRQIKRFFNFHFSHFKSMVTLGCHSNQRYYQTRIRNTTYIEANVISMYDKFQLHTFWFMNRFLNIFTKIDPFCSTDNQSNSLIRKKKSYET